MSKPKTIIAVVVPALIVVIAAITWMNAPFSGDDPSGTSEMGQLEFSVTPPTFMGEDEPVTTSYMIDCSVESDLCAETLDLHKRFSKGIMCTMIGGGTQYHVTGEFNGEKVDLRGDGVNSCYEDLVKLFEKVETAPIKPNTSEDSNPSRTDPNPKPNVSMDE